MSKLGDSKGAELLAQLKAGMVKPSSQSELPRTPVRHEVNLERAFGTARPAASPHLTPDAERAARQHRKKKAKQAEQAEILVIKPRNAAERKAYEEAQSAGSSTVASSPRPKAAIANFGAAEFGKLARARESLEGFAANHRGPGEVLPNDRNLIIRRIKAGAAASSQIVRPEDGYFLGYDFGTSTTKVVARYPHRGVDEAFAIDVPLSVASGGQPHLFPTAVWWDKDRDRFALTPDHGLVLLDSFKSALIDNRGLRICNKSGLSMATAATAFVALHLAYCIGAALEAKAEFTIDLINVGVPVAAFEGTGNVALFRKVLRAAVRLVAIAPNFTSADIQAAIAANDEPPIQLEIHAELAGAIAGYCSATRHYLGGHMIIDCGSATLDMATFDLDQRTNRPIGIYGARVENLGADACAMYVEAEHSVDECRKAARYVEHLVYDQSRKAKPNLFSQEDRQFPYQIILIGGGIHCHVHQPLFAQMATAFAKPFHHPKVADLLRYDADCDPGRLILADGLAREPNDLRDIALPKPPPPPTWQDPTAPGPEQV